MSRIFISYKRVDKVKVFKIKDQIEAALGEKCWIDLDGIESDAQFKNIIIKAINQAEVVLFMYSKEHAKITSFENDWTIRELNFAAKKDKRIVFVNIDGSPLIDIFEFDFGTKQQVDATSKVALEKLMADLQMWLPKSVSCEGVETDDEAPKKEEKPEQGPNAGDSGSTLLTVKKCWKWVVFYVHCTLSCLTLICAISSSFLLFTAAVASLGTYGAWMSVKKRRWALGVMSVGDLLAPMPWLLGGHYDVYAVQLVCIVVCLIINWLVLHVNVATAKDE